ncbi:MAG: hypothetical protein WCF18_07900 [Chthoniobacteraceae bacterium]
MLIGSELIAKPPDRKAPLILRIASARPRGPVVRYDFRFTGFVAGEHDLRDCLIRQDGSIDEFLPPLMVQIGGSLPENHNGWLIQHRDLPIVMRETYKWTMAGAAVAWGLMAIPLGVFNNRRPKETDEQREALELPTSKPQLHPLLEAAIAGKLDTGQKLQLERLLLTSWRSRFGISAHDLPAARSRLRDHPEAGVLLRALEQWLYQKPGTTAMDLEAEFSPYGTLENRSASLQTEHVPTLAMSVPRMRLPSLPIGNGDERHATASDA